jgi:hypothetical protein
MGNTIGPEISVDHGCVVQPARTVPEIDWDNLKFVETQDEEGRIELMGEDQLYALLGLRDEDERAKKAEQEAAKKAKNREAQPSGTTNMDDDMEGAAIPVSDVVVDKLMICYDKQNPKMDVETLYPSMKEFRLAVRQFAINKEFELGTEKSCKSLFRGFCKGEDCPWRIVARRQDDMRTIKVT